jgi:ankyrin repeat protein
VKLLLADNRVDPDVRNVNGRTPLSIAAEEGHEEILELLLATRRVELESKDVEGRTPLAWSEENKHDVVQRLLAAEISRSVATVT